MALDLRLPRLSPGTVLGGLALIVASGGVAFAAIPSSDGVLTGCYSKTTGQLRLIDAEAGATCAKYEKLVTWNQAGQPGLDGEDGEDGEDGTDGVNGATNVVVRKKIFSGSASTPGAAIRDTAMCQPGERATGGGFDAGGNGSDMVIFQNHPVPTTDGAVPNGWRVAIDVADTTYEFGSGVIYVVCVSP
jgi:hypothetical protein